MLLLLLHNWQSIVYIFSLSFSLPSSCLSISYYYALLCQCIIRQTFKATHARFSYIKNHLLEEEIPFWLYGNAQRSQMWMWQIAMWRSIRNHKDLSIVYWILNRSWKVKASMVYVLYNKHFLRMQSNCRKVTQTLPPFPFLLGWQVHTKLNFTEWENAMLFFLLDICSMTLTSLLHISSLSFPSLQRFTKHLQLYETQQNYEVFVGHGTIDAVNIYWKLHMTA